MTEETIWEKNSSMKTNYGRRLNYIKRKKIVKSLDAGIKYHILVPEVTADESLNGINQGKPHKRWVYRCITW